jgi:hypothetical protein
MLTTEEEATATEELRGLFELFEDAHGWTVGTGYLQAPSRDIDDSDLGHDAE